MSVWVIFWGNLIFHPVFKIDRRLIFCEESSYKSSFGLWFILSIDLLVMLQQTWRFFINLDYLTLSLSLQGWSIRSKQAGEKFFPLFRQYSSSFLALSPSFLIFSEKNPRKYLRFSSTKLPITTLVFDRSSFSLSLFLSPLYKSFSLFFFPFLSIEKIQGFRKSYLIPFFFVSNFIFKKDYTFE